MYSILLTTYKNPKYLKLCVDSILNNSYYKTHQLCIHVNGYDQETVDYLNSKNIKYTITRDNIGITKAGSICAKYAIYDTVLSANDDMYFSKNWDYYLHEWETELKNKFPDYKLLICYRMCEPLAGSFLPICDAGTDIDTFSIDKLNEYIKIHSRHELNSEWLSNALYPKDIYIKCNPLDYNSKICDIEFIMSVLKYLKDNKIKFLIFRINDCCVYHFGSVVTKRLMKENKTEQNKIDSDEVLKFENKWNINIDTAFNNVLKKEVIRSINLIEELKEPTISTYITTYNALFYQSTLEQTIRHSLIFSDEIIIANSENSSDGTNDLLDILHEEYPDKIKIYTYKEDNKICNILADRKNFALSKCTKDYCILQDDDEVIHEQYANYIRQLPTICPETMAFRFNTIHFYRSYNHYQPEHPNWYNKKIYMIKNNSNIHHGKVNNDLDNFITKDNINNLLVEIPVDDLESPQIVTTPITVYHYGWCRNDAILLLKKYHQEIDWHTEDYWKEHKFPFKFDDPKTLPIFKETHPKYMIPIIQQEQKLNSRHIEEFTKT